MALAQDDAEHRRVAFWITGLAVFAFWNMATLIGALIGTSIDPKALGLDAAFPAGFVAMVAPHLRTRRGLPGRRARGGDLPPDGAVHADRRADPVRRRGRPRRAPARAAEAAHEVER